MHIRHTMKARRALTAVAITTGLVLTVAGCGGGGDDKPKSGADTSSAATNDGTDEKPQESQAPADEKVLAEVKNNGITLTVTSAVRDAGGFLTVQGKVTNGTSGIWLGTEWKSDETELSENGGSLAGAGVIDATAKKRYLVLRDTEGRCLCTKFQGGVNRGQTVEWFAQFPAPPEGTTKAEFQVPTMPPAPIEISDGE
ncbi:hypothetical protein ACFVT5_02985 [Streptomyces sp. NPDC058001]|uniref:hypothetical protein n=1 Tax=Streptomyces sp. NPDC058001 TaxID=3346300 RepID=UPI0036EA5588